MKTKEADPLAPFWQAGVAVRASPHGGHACRADRGPSWRSLSDPTPTALQNKAFALDAARGMNHLDPRMIASNGSRYHVPTPPPLRNWLPSPPCLGEMRGFHVHREAPCFQITSARAERLASAGVSLVIHVRDSVWRLGSSTHQGTQRRSSPERQAARLPGQLPMRLHRVHQRSQSAASGFPCCSLA